MDKLNRNAELAEWQELLKKAENFGSTVEEREEVHEIEIAEVLGIGHVYIKPPEVAVVRDTKGKIWLIPETHTSREGKDGLVSRHKVGSVMKMVLIVKKEVRSVFTTEAYLLNADA